MWCAYVFSIIALLGLRPALRPGGEGIIAWIAQTFLQLVLLSVIMVGQNVQSIASDLRSQHTYDDTVEILDRLNIHTAGGIKDLQTGSMHWRPSSEVMPPNTSAKTASRSSLRAVCVIIPALTLDRDHYLRLCIESFCHD